MKYYYLGVKQSDFVKDNSTKAKASIMEAFYKLVPLIRAKKLKIHSATILGLG